MSPRPHLCRGLTPSIYQILGNLAGADSRMKVGREFWDFISEKENFHKDLFRLLEASSANILENSFISLSRLKFPNWRQAGKRNIQVQLLTIFSKAIYDYNKTKSHFAIYRSNGS